MKLTKNFNRIEFDSKDGTPVPESLMENIGELAEQLQILRDEIGVPIHIISGYRTPRHNKAIGGAKFSQHLQAKAADCVVKSLTPAQLKKIVERLIKENKLWFGGIGLYKTFLHLDIRNKPARW